MATPSTVAPLLPRWYETVDRRLVISAIAVLVGLATVVAFVPAIGGQFLDWDDNFNFTDNANLRGIGWKELKWAWTTSLGGVYQPLGWLLFQIEHQIFGLDPLGFHAVSLLFHAANAVLVFFVMAAILARVKQRAGAVDQISAHTQLAAGVAALLYAVHPLRTEVVAWLSCQPYLPCVFFALLSVLAYMRADASADGKCFWYLSSFGCFLCSLLFKAVAVMIPAALVVLDAYPLRRGLGRRLWLRKIPFFAISALVAGLAIWARHREQALVPFADSGIEQRVAHGIHGVFFYLWQTLVPLEIVPFYSYPAGLSLLQPRYALLTLVLLWSCVSLSRRARISPGLTVAFFCYLILLLPRWGFFRTGEYVAADRYTYLSTLPLFMLVAGVVDRLLAVWKAGLIVLSLSLVFVLAFLSWRQTAVWRSSETFWSFVLDHGGRSSALVLRALATTRGEQGRHQEALELAQTAAALKPRNGDVRRTLGAALFRVGRTDEALREVRIALSLDPHARRAHADVGLILTHQGSLEGALAYLQEALRQDPQDQDARVNLGGLLCRLGKKEDGVRELRQAVQAKPNHREGRHNLGVALYELGRSDEALEHLGAVTRIDPTDAQAHALIGLILLAKGRMEDAGTYLRDALRLDPRSKDAQDGLARLKRTNG